MKKILLLLLLPFLSLLFVSQATASSPHTERKPVTITLPVNQTVDHDYFAVGDNVTILGTVNGDVYTAGGNVTILGEINGDLLAAGGNVTVDGIISQDVRVAGGTVHIAGTVGQNVTVVGGNIDVASNAKIGHSITTAGGQILLMSPIPQDLNFAGGMITVGNTIEKNATGFAGNLILLSDAKIKGNLTYTSSEPVTLQSGATVSGKTTHLLPTTQQQKAQTSGKNVALGIITVMAWIKFFSFLSTLVVGFMLIRLLPVFLNNVETTITTKSWASLGLGILTAILAPIVFILLLITIIGLPIAFVLLGTYLIFLYIAKIIMVVVIGKKLVRLVSPTKGWYWGLIIGAFLYELITWITPLNLLIALITYTIGLGALLQGNIQYYHELRSKKMI